MTAPRQRPAPSWWGPGLAAGALALALAALLREPAPAPLPASAPAPVAARLDEAALRQELAALHQRIAALETAGGRQEVVDQARIDDLVAAALERRGSDAAGPAPSTRRPGEAPLPAATSRLLQELVQAPFGAARDELWKQLREAGAVDAAVAHFENLAKAQPGSPDAQTDLGAAYIQKLLQTADEAQRIELGSKIDAQFDRALELQPDHWEARFRKAVGLTYGPTLSGRQAQAVEHFEALVAQQAGQPVAPHFAQTYVYLGRLYAQRGDTERAQQIWQQGVARHPQDQELAQLLRR